MMSAASEEDNNLSMTEEGGVAGNDLGASPSQKSSPVADSLPIDQGEAEFATNDDDNNHLVDDKNNGAPSPSNNNNNTNNDISAGADDDANRDSILSSPDDVHRVLRRKCYYIVGLLLVIGILIGVVVALVITQQDNNNGNNNNNSAAAGGEDIFDLLAEDEATPFQNPSSESNSLAPTPTEITTNTNVRLQSILDYLVSNNVVVDPSTLSSGSSSPQYQAALWIANTDDYTLPIPSSSSSFQMKYNFNQRYSLAVLYFALGGPSWWWQMDFLTGVHECDWFHIQFIYGVYWGIHCDGEPDISMPSDGDGGEGEDFLQDELDLWSQTRIVTHIDFPPDNNVLGTLPPELRNLLYIKQFHLEQNVGLTGPIPSEYGEFAHMDYLAIISTSLNGKIPSTFGDLKKLQVLSLESNTLKMDSNVGDLDFLNDMVDLQYLALDYNPDITGTIPDISNLAKLAMLSVPNTGMSGMLPESLSKLTALRLLFLDDCFFTGSVNNVLKSLKNLTHVYLEDNSFTDTIDDTFFVELDNLVHLDISNCSFTGTVPGHLFNFSNLQVLDMSNNNLNGELPSRVLSEDAKNSKLQFLSLHTNKLSGPIPSSIKNLKNLNTLDLSLNQFSGDIPTEISDLSKLSILFLGRNSFNEAPVPVVLRNMTQLTEISLKSSSLTETIPAWFGELKNLLLLDLGENELTGTVPQSLNNLTDLTVLILNDNQLTGELGLGKLSYLEVILIDDNSFTGTTDEICDAHVITHFVSDCGGDEDLVCTCCTLCCSDNNATCNDEEWLGNTAGIWEFNYERQRWNFGDGKSISPYFDYNFEQSQPPPP